MSTQFNTHGIRILDAKTAKELHPDNVRVNPKFAPMLDKLFAELAAQGCVAIYTNGFLCNRTIRNSNKTSKHSSGYRSNGYKAWGDGSNGCLAFDLWKVLFRKGRQETYLIVTRDRAFMIRELRRMGFKVRHTGEPGDPKVSPDHLHVEYLNG